MRYTKLSTFTRIVLEINLLYFLLLVLRAGNALMESANSFFYIIGALMVLLKPFESLLLIILFVLTLIFWKKTKTHMWQLLPFIFTIFSSAINSFFNTTTNFNLLLILIGFAVSIVAFTTYQRVEKSVANS